MTSRVALVALLVTFSAGGLSAQVPAGGEFQVNTYTTYYQRDPSVASDAAGNFVVVWSGHGDGNLFGISAQRYAASGARLGSEFRVNTYTAYGQTQPSVASDAAGNFVVAWSGPGDGDSSGVFGQRYDASGAKRGAEFRVNTFTTYSQERPSVASGAAGSFVVAWQSSNQDGASWQIFARRYDASGAPLGPEFHVNTVRNNPRIDPSVASDANDNIVVVWTSYFQDGDYLGVFGQRYDGAGGRRGAEFQVNTYTTGRQYEPSVVSDAAGNFVVAWSSYGQEGGYGFFADVFAQRYDSSGTRVASEFRVNPTNWYYQSRSSTVSDAAGDFTVVWLESGTARPDLVGGVPYARRYDSSGALRGSEFRLTSSRLSQFAAASDEVGNLVAIWTSSGHGIFGQRFGGLAPAALWVDPYSTGVSDGNGVLEAGEFVAVRPWWRNVNGAALTFNGTGLSFDGPPAAGVSYVLVDATGTYGTAPNGAVFLCSDCYSFALLSGGTRPATHWDATFTERLTPDVLGQTKPWSIHVGESFTDVPRTSGYYRFVETLLHKGVTAGCTANSYCPADPVTREQMSVFVLASKEGAGYLPSACGTPVFSDVPAASPYCRYIEELSRRGVVSGCGGGGYCPTQAVTREQMSVFLLHTLDPLLVPPACGAPVFADVPASSPFCIWIEELARRGVTSGCGGGNYCPTNPVTREQIAVFLSATFGLTLYGP